MVTKIYFLNTESITVTLAIADKNKTKEVDAKEWKDTHEDSSGSVTKLKKLLKLIGA